MSFLGEFHIFWEGTMKRPNVDYNRTRELRKHVRLCRKFRPTLPNPNRTPMPEDLKFKEEQAKRYSLYFRVWTRLRGLAPSCVPNIADMDIVPGRNDRKRLNRKTPAADAMGERSFEICWKTYIRGQVPSQHAKRLIRQFMVAKGVRRGGGCIGCVGW